MGCVSKSHKSKYLIDGFYRKFGENLVYEDIHNLTCKYAGDIIKKPNRKYMAWIGGLILTETEAFHEMKVTKQEYEEYGPVIIQRKWDQSIKLDSVDGCP